MKKRLVFFVLGLLVLANLGYAQRYRQAYVTGSFEEPHFYVSMGLTFPLGNDFSMTYFSRQGWGAAVAYQNFSRVARKVPADYDSGDGIFHVDSKPSDQFTVFSAHALKVFPGKSSGFRFGLEIGSSWLRFRVAENFRPANPNCTIFHCDPNYSYQKVEHIAIGLSLKGKIEWVLNRAMGFELGLSGNFSKRQPLILANMGISFGSVRDY